MKIALILILFFEPLLFNSNAQTKGNNANTNSCILGKVAPDITAQPVFGNGGLLFTTGGPSTISCFEIYPWAVRDTTVSFWGLVMQVTINGTSWTLDSIIATTTYTTITASDTFAPQTINANLFIPRAGTYYLTSYYNTYFYSDSSSCFCTYPYNCSGNAIIGSVYGGSIVNDEYRIFYNISIDGCSVGISENDTPDEVEIYPNPTRGSIKISLDKYLDNGMIRIYNVIGEKVFSAPINGMNNSISFNLPGGLYIVEVADGKEIWRRKIINE